MDISTLWLEYEEGRKEIQRFYSLETQSKLMRSIVRRIRIKKKHVVMQPKRETFHVTHKFTPKKKKRKLVGKINWFPKRTPINILKLSRKERGKILHQINYIQSSSAPDINESSNEGKERMINVLIKCPNDATICLTLNEETTIQEIKDFLMEKTGIPVSVQRVRALGRYVKDTLSIKTLITEGNDLNLTMFDGILKGGGGCASKGKSADGDERPTIKGQKNGKVRGKAGQLSYRSIPTDTKQTQDKERGRKSKSHDVNVPIGGACSNVPDGASVSTGTQDNTVNIKEQPDIQMSSAQVRIHPNTNKNSECLVSLSCGNPQDPTEDPTAEESVENSYSMQSNNPKKLHAAHDMEKEKKLKKYHSSNDMERLRNPKPQNVNLNLGDACDTKAGDENVSTCMERNTGGCTEISEDSVGNSQLEQLCDPEGLLSIQDKENERRLTMQDSKANLARSVNTLESGADANADAREGSSESSQLEELNVPEKLHSTHKLENQKVFKPQDVNVILGGACNTSPVSATDSTCMEENIENSQELEADPSIREVTSENSQLVELSTPGENEMNNEEGECLATQVQEVQRIMSLGSNDYYEILEVARDCSLKDLTRAYKRLAFVLHPDKNKAPGAGDAFKVLGRAYCTLRCPRKREQYDQTGTDNASAMASSSSDYEADMDPDELFQSFFPNGLHSGYMDDAMMYDLASKLGDEWYLFGRRLGIPLSRMSEFAGLGRVTWRPLLMLDKWRCLIGKKSEASQKEILQTALREIKKGNLSRMIDEMEGTFDQLLAHLSTFLTSDWEELGVKLKIPIQMMEEIQYSTEREDEGKAKVKMLQAWRDMAGSTSIPRLLEPLHEHGRNDILQWFEEKHGIVCRKQLPNTQERLPLMYEMHQTKTAKSKPDLSQTKSENDLFVEGIKRHAGIIQKKIFNIPYFDLTERGIVDLSKLHIKVNLRNNPGDKIKFTDSEEQESEPQKSDRKSKMSTPVEESKPEDPTRSHDPEHESKFISPEISAKEMFKEMEGLPVPNTILIEGPPGSGKSTFLRAYLYSWAKMINEGGIENTQQADFIGTIGAFWKEILYIRANEIATTLDASVRNSMFCTKNQQDALYSCLENEPDVSLLLIDGVDEIRDDKVIDEIRELVTRGQNGQGPRVIVTARDHLSRIKADLFDRHMKCEGFNRSQAFQYMENYFAVKKVADKSPIDIIQRQDSEKWNHILNNPLRLFMLCVTIEERLLQLSEEQKLTTTKLYQSHLDIIFKREAKKQVSSSQSGNMLYNEEQLKQQISSFCFLSIRLFLENGKVISKDLLRLFQIPEDSPVLVFLTCEYSVNISGKEEQRWRYAHETLFEFLAAKGFLQLDRPTQTKLLIPLCSVMVYRNFMVLLFGLMGQEKSYSDQHLEDILTCILLLQGHFKGHKVSSLANRLRLITEKTPGEVKDLIEVLIRNNQALQKNSASDPSDQHIDSELQLLWEGLRVFLEENQELAKEEAWFGYLITDYVEPSLKHIYDCCLESCREKPFHDILTKILPCTGRDGTICVMNGYAKWGTIRRETLHGSHIIVQGQSPKGIVETMQYPLESISAIRTSLEISAKYTEIEIIFKDVLGNPPPEACSLEHWIHILKLTASSRGQLTLLLAKSMRLGEIFEAVKRVPIEPHLKTLTIISGQVQLGILLTFLEVHKRLTSDVKLQQVDLLSGSGEKLGSISMALAASDKRVCLAITSFGIINMGKILNQIKRVRKVKSLHLCFLPNSESNGEKECRLLDLNQSKRLLNVIEEAKCRFILLDCLSEMRLEPIFDMISSMGYLSHASSIKIHCGTVCYNYLKEWTEEYIIKSPVYNIELQNVNIEGIPRYGTRSSADIAELASFGALIIENAHEMANAENGPVIYMVWNLPMIAFAFKMCSSCSIREERTAFEHLYSWLRTANVEVSQIDDYKTYLIRYKLNASSRQLQQTSGALCYSLETPSFNYICAHFDELAYFSRISGVQIRIAREMNRLYRDGTSVSLLDINSSGLWTFKVDSACFIQMKELKSPKECIDIFHSFYSVQTLSSYKKQITVSFKVATEGAREDYDVKNWMNLLDLAKDIQTLEIYLPYASRLEALLNAIKDCNYIQSIGKFNLIGGLVDPLNFGPWMLAYRTNSKTLNIQMSRTNFGSFKANIRIPSCIAFYSSQFEEESRRILDRKLTVLTPRDAAVLLTRSCELNKKFNHLDLVVRQLFLGEGHYIAPEEEYCREAWIELFKVVKVAGISTMYIQIQDSIDIAGLLQAISQEMSGTKVKIYVALGMIKFGFLSSWVESYREKNVSHNVYLSGKIMPYDNCAKTSDQRLVIRTNSGLVWSKLAQDRSCAHLTVLNPDDLKTLVVGQLSNLTGISSITISVNLELNKDLHAEMCEGAYTKAKWLKCLKALADFAGKRTLDGLCFHIGSDIPLKGLLEAMAEMSYLEVYKMVYIQGGLITYKDPVLLPEKYNVGESEDNVHFSPLENKNEHPDLPWWRVEKTPKELSILLFTPMDHFRALEKMSLFTWKHLTLVLCKTMHGKSMVAMDNHHYNAECWTPLLETIHDHPGLLQLGIILEECLPLEGLLKAIFKISDATLKINVRGGSISSFEFINAMNVIKQKPANLQMFEVHFVDKISNIVLNSALPFSCISYLDDSITIKALTPRDLHTNFNNNKGIFEECTKSEICLQIIDDVFREIRVMVPEEEFTGSAWKQILDDMMEIEQHKLRIILPKRTPEDGLLEAISSHACISNKATITLEGGHMSSNFVSSLGNMLGRKLPLTLGVPDVLCAEHDHQRQGIAGRVLFQLGNRRPRLRIWGFSSSDVLCICQRFEGFTFNSLIPIDLTLDLCESPFLSEEKPGSYRALFKIIDEIGFCSLEIKCSTKLIYYLLLLIIAMPQLHRSRTVLIDGGQIEASCLSDLTLQLREKELSNVHFSNVCIESNNELCRSVEVRSGLPWHWYEEDNAKLRIVALTPRDMSCALRKNMISREITCLDLVQCSLLGGVYLGVAPKTEYNREAWEELLCTIGQMGKHIQKIEVCLEKQLELDGLLDAFSFLDQMQGERTFLVKGGSVENSTIYAWIETQTKKQSRNKTKFSLGCFLDNDNTLTVSSKPCNCETLNNCAKLSTEASPYELSLFLRFCWIPPHLSILFNLNYDGYPHHGATKEHWQQLITEVFEDDVRSLDLEISSTEGVSNILSVLFHMKDKLDGKEICIKGGHLSFDVFEKYNQEIRQGHNELKLVLLSTNITDYPDCAVIDSGLMCSECVELEDELNIQGLTPCDMAHRLRGQITESDIQIVRLKITSIMGIPNEMVDPEVYSAEAWSDLLRTLDWTNIRWLDVILNDSVDMAGILESIKTQGAMKHIKNLTFSHGSVTTRKLFHWIYQMRIKDPNYLIAFHAIEFRGNSQFKAWIDSSPERLSLRVSNPDNLSSVFLLAQGILANKPEGRPYETLAISINDSIVESQSYAEEAWHPILAQLLKLYIMNLDIKLSDDVPISGLLKVLYNLSGIQNLHSMQVTGGSISYEELHHISGIYSLCQDERSVSIQSLHISQPYATDCKMLEACGVLKGMRENGGSDIQPVSIEEGHTIIITAPTLGLVLELIVKNVQCQPLPKCLKINVCQEICADLGFKIYESVEANANVNEWDSLLSYFQEKAHLDRLEIGSAPSSCIHALFDALPKHSYLSNIPEVVIHDWQNYQHLNFWLNTYKWKAEILNMRFGYGSLLPHSYSNRKRMFFLSALPFASFSKEGDTMAVTALTPMDAFRLCQEKLSCARGMAAIKLFITIGPLEVNGDEIYPRERDFDYNKISDGWWELLHLLKLHQISFIHFKLGDSVPLEHLLEALLDVPETEGIIEGGSAKFCNINGWRRQNKSGVVLHPRDSSTEPDISLEIGREIFKLVNAYKIESSAITEPVDHK